MILTQDDLKGLEPLGSDFKYKAILSEIKTLEDIERIDIINEQYSELYGYNVIINIKDVLKLKDKLRHG